MRSIFRLLGTCLGACLISLGLGGCDSGVTNLEQDSAPTTTYAEQALSKKGGKAGRGGGKGSASDFDQLLQGALAGQDSVQIAADNKKKLETLSLSFDLAFDFSTTSGQSIVDVQQSGLSVGDILANGDCSFECPDIEACDAADGGRSGIVSRLQSALTRTDPRDLEVSVLISKDNLNTQDSDHFVSVRDRSGPFDAAPGYPHLNLGRNHVPQNFLKAEFAGVDVNDATVTRVFTLSLGTVHVWERVGVASGADLICNNLDEILATIAPISN